MDLEARREIMKKKRRASATRCWFVAREQSTRLGGITVSPRSLRENGKRSNQIGDFIT
jgi:hypothetical protein